MAFLDLQEGVLELFVDAQRLVMDRRRSAAEGAAARIRVGRRASTAAWEARVLAQLRARRAAAPLWAPARPGIELVSCPRCGSQVEFRQGCRAPTSHPCRR